MSAQSTSYRFAMVKNNAAGKVIMYPAAYQEDNPNYLTDLINKYPFYDVYYTTNCTFEKPTKARPENIKELGIFVIDIDDHWTGSMTKQRAQALNELLIMDHYNKDIPMPYFVHWTGRGLQIHIKINAITDVIKYQEVYNALVRLVSEAVWSYPEFMLSSVESEHKKLKFDPIWPGHPFRAEGSWNTIGEVRSEGIYRNGNAVYDIDGLIDDFIPDVHEVTRKLVEGSSTIDPLNKQVFKSKRKGWSAKTLIQAQINDLIKLQLSRNEIACIQGLYSNDHNIGHRNNTLFYYGLLCAHLYTDTQKVYDSMLDYNKNYRQPQEPKEVEDTYNSVMRNITKYGTPSNRKMINALNITPEEQLTLDAIISKTEVKKRTVVRVKRHKAQKRAQRAKQKDSVMLQARALHLAGYSYKAIAQSLNISVGSAFNYCK